MSSLNLPYSHSVSTGDQCRDADRQTIEELGIDGFTLMETAGLQAARFTGKKFPSPSTALFVCGKGNNGGDALVTARYLSIHHNHQCHILFPGGMDGLSRGTAKNLVLLQKMKEQKSPLFFYESLDTFDRHNFDYIIDGLLGTGLQSNVRAPVDSAVDLINAMDAPVLSIDIPTGLHSDRGRIMGKAVCADYTLSFGSRKLGFYLNDGPACTGEVLQFDLSFPSVYRGKVASLIAPDIASRLPEIHRVADHKYSDRSVYVVAGSEGMTGAAVMAAASAWKTGVGAVTLVTPRGLLDIYEKTLPSIIKSPVGNSDDVRFTEEHSETALHMIHQKNGVLLIGPGLGRHESTLSFAGYLLTRFSGSAIIDADALHILPELDKPPESDWILTPHPGEVKSLAGRLFEDDYDRILWAREYAGKNSRWLLSKGNPVFVGTPQGRNYITGYDSRIFARAGFGDILSGKVAGNLAITNDPELSIIRALLDSYMQAEQLRGSSGRAVEPNDFL